MPTILQIRRGRTFWRVKATSPSPMLGVVVYEHVVRDSQDMAVHIDCCRDNNLQGREDGEPVKPRFSGGKRLGANSSSWKGSSPQTPRRQTRLLSVREPELSGSASLLQPGCPSWFSSDSENHLIVLRHRCKGQNPQTEFITGAYTWPPLHTDVYFPAWKTYLVFFFWPKPVWVNMPICFTLLKQCIISNSRNLLLHLE